MGSLDEGRYVLAAGPLLRFREPLDPSIPRISAGCYTIWDSDGRYLYAGMAGRWNDSRIDRSGPLG
jgi:hypothetical protein